MTATETDGPDRREHQDLLTAERDGDEIHLAIETERLCTTRQFTLAEYEQFLLEIKRTTWLTRDEDQLAEDSVVLSDDIMASTEGECHECGYEGKLVENDIGTVYCPKCRSTNVGWPVR